MPAITLPVTFAILAAAFMHASWNALLKRSEDRTSNITLLMLVWLIIGIFTLPFLPLPAPESWFYIFLSLIVHVFYCLILAHTYKHGDLGQAYTLIRGVVPPFVAIGALLLIHESPSHLGWIGIAIISIGLLSLSDVTNKTLRSLKLLFFTSATACTIVLYTIIDGIGVRLSGNAFSYLLWLGSFQAICLLAIAMFTKPKKTIKYACKNWHILSLSGVLSLCAYGIVLWAMTQAPIGIVSALRETSVIFAAFIGALCFKESFGKKRIICAVLICIGAILIKI